MKFTFTTIILGSDPESALVHATERARWAPPKDGALTPEALALALKTDHVVFERPDRIPAQRVLDWIAGVTPTPAVHARAVQRARRQATNPDGPVVIVPLSYREETEVLAARGLEIGHGYHRPFAGYALGTVILPAEKAVQPKKIARRPRVAA